jgi:hypothetical protein
MALPINSTPVYNLEIPSTGKMVKYRPFLIKEEKALLIAQQSEDAIVMVNSLKEVIASCLSNKDNVGFDVNELATFDLEYIFAQLRAKSVGEVIELVLGCDTCTDEKAKSKVSVDLTKLKVIKNPEHSLNIKLYGDVGIVMRYPTMDVVKKLESVDSTDIEQVFSIVVECIDYIYTTDEMFHAKDQTKEELVEFLNNLTSDQFVNIQKFFETMPKLSQDVDYVCPVCNAAHHKVLEGLNSFF